MRARVSKIVLDCPDPDRLADFYASLLGLSRHDEGDGWVTLGDPDHLPMLALRKTTDFVRPTWPSGDNPQHQHLDVVVGDLQRSVGDALDAGGEVLDDRHQHHVFVADPVGHVMCLVQDRSEDDEAPQGHP